MEIVVTARRAISATSRLVRVTADAARDVDFRGQTMMDDRGIRAGPNELQSAHLFDDFIHE